jgi:hypothetical protein
MAQTSVRVSFMQMPLPLIAGPECVELLDDNSEPSVNVSPLSPA